MNNLENLKGNFESFEEWQEQAMCEVEGEVFISKQWDVSFSEGEVQVWQVYNEENTFSELFTIDFSSDNGNVLVK